MRVASRALGVVLVLAGSLFVLLSILVPYFHPQWQSVLAESSSPPTWAAALVFGLFGILLVFFGRHLLMSVDSLDDTKERSPSRYAPYFAAHRPWWKAVAQIGLVTSLIRFGAACLGVDWPGRWVTWALLIAAIGLALIESKIASPEYRDHIDWEAVCAPLQPFLKLAWKAGGIVFLVLLLLCFWNGWAPHKVAPRLVLAALVALLFAWEVMFFSYGTYRRATSRAA